MWWFLIHNSVHHYGFVIGHFPYHNPRTDFSDEELGIPDDSEGLAPVIADVRSTLVDGLTPHQSLIPPYMMQRLYGDIGKWKF